MGKNMFTVYDDEGKKLEFANSVDAREAVERCGCSYKRPDKQAVALLKKKRAVEKKQLEEAAELLKKNKTEDDSN